MKYPSINALVENNVGLQRMLADDKFDADNDRHVRIMMVGVPS